MKRPARQRKKLNYPIETEGSRLAAKARKIASKLTPEERRAHFNAAMVLIYGGDNPKEVALTRLIWCSTWRGAKILPMSSWKYFKQGVTTWFCHRRRYLLNLNEEALLLAFNEADLPPVHPVHPKRLLKALR